MTVDRTMIATFLAVAAGRVVTDSDDAADIADRLDAFAGLSSTDAASEALDIARVIAENVVTPSAYADLAQDVTTMDAETASIAQFLYCVMLAVAAGRVDWPSRPAAISARTGITDAAETARATAVIFGADLLTWFNGLVSVSVRLVSEIAATRAPMIRVEAGISLPSTVLAYHLYGDATRASGLVDGAGSTMPMLMPSTFEALAS